MNVEIDIVWHACPQQGCGALFAVPLQWNRRRMDDHTNFYCPNGHTMSYPGKTEAQILRSALDNEREAHEKCRREVRRLKRGGKRRK